MSGHKTKQLFAFQHLVDEDPLFAAEGMDLENAEQALAELETISHELEDAFANGSLLRHLFLIRYPIGRYALPLPFIRAFIRSERARRKFCIAPDEERAQDLLSAWDETATTLATCVARYTTLHRLLTRIERKKVDEFIFQDMFGYCSDLRDIESTLTLFCKNAARLRGEVAKRRAFVSGEELHEDPTVRRSHNTQSDLTYKPGELTGTFRELHMMEKMHVLPFRRADVLEQHGPLKYGLSIIDGRDVERTFMFYIVRDRETHVKSAHISLVDRFFFMKLWKSDDPRSAGVGMTNYRSLIEQGIPYWYQPATNLYMTRDQRYWADIATIVDLKKRPALDRALVLRQRSSMFDLLLGACVVDLRGYVTHTKRRAHDGDLSSYSGLFGLLMRSHPSMYYMPFNGSVWRLSEQPDFLGPKRVDERDRLYRPEHEVLPLLSKELLPRVMSGARVREEADRAFFRLP